jgi:CRISPR system Cascade subunit CasA
MGTRYGDQALENWQKFLRQTARKAFTESIQSIRNYQARAVALRALEYQLAKLSGEVETKKGKAVKGKSPKANAKVASA